MDKKIETLDGKIIDITIWLDAKLGGKYLRKCNSELRDVIWNYFVDKKMEIQWNNEYTIHQALRILNLINF